MGILGGYWQRARPTAAPRRRRGSFSGAAHERSFTYGLRDPVSVSKLLRFPDGALQRNAGMVVPSCGLALPLRRARSKLLTLPLRCLAVLCVDASTQVVQRVYRSLRDAITPVTETMTPCREYLHIDEAARDISWMRPAQLLLVRMQYAMAIISGTELARGILDKT